MIFRACLVLYFPDEKETLATETLFSEYQETLGT